MKICIIMWRQSVSSLKKRLFIGGSVIMSDMSLQQLLEKSAEQYVKNGVCAFLEGQESFANVTQMLSKFGFRKQKTTSVLRPLRNYGDPYRAEALFRWIELREW